MVRPSRGQIYLVNFDPTVGAEIRKTRPAFVVQDDTANKSSPVTIVAAITSQFEEPLYPTKVLLPAGRGTDLSVDSVVLLNQLRTVDRRRLASRIGQVAAQTMRLVNDARVVAIGRRRSGAASQGGGWLNTGKTGGSR